LNISTGVPTTPSYRPHEPDEFGIEINFSPHSDTPSRVFRVMTSLIDSFQEIDGFLAGSIATGLKPSTLLEDIESGSIRVWLRNILESIDDESLKSGEWKKVIGAYLVKAKRIMIDWTDRRTTVTAEAEIAELRQELLDAAAQTDVLRIPTYVPIPSNEVVRSIQLISDALQPLNEDDSVSYLSSERIIEFNKSFEVVPAALTDLLVREVMTSEAPMILVIKRPDFLGDSKWEFRHDRRVFEARILDPAWMTEFRLGTVVIHPGDALRAVVRSTVRYGFDGEVVDSQHEIIKVDGVIHTIRPSQGHFFNLPQEGP
jgi:hypothetical protein